MIRPSSFTKNKIYFHLVVKISEKHLQPKEIRKLWSDLPAQFRKQKHLAVHSCVLMSNHVHAIMSVEEMYFEFQEINLRVELLKLLQKSDTPDFIRLIRIESYAQYREVYRYVYRNPVDAGLVPLAEMYEYSTLHELIGFGKKRLFACDNMGLIANPYPILAWINWSMDQTAIQYH